MKSKLIDSLKSELTLADKLNLGKVHIDLMIPRSHVIDIISELEAINPEKLIKKIKDLDTNLADDYYIDGYYQAIADVVKIIKGE